MTDPLSDQFIRLRSRDRWLTVDNETVRDKRLSFAARGLLNYMLSLPDGWKINMEHLIEQSPAGPGALKTMIRELKRFRYMDRINWKDKRGHWKWRTIVSERPLSDDEMSLCLNNLQMDLGFDGPVIKNQPVDESLANSPVIKNPLTGDSTSGLSTSGKPTDIRKTSLKEVPTQEKSKGLKTFKKPRKPGSNDDLDEKAIRYSIEEMEVPELLIGDIKSAMVRMFPSLPFDDYYRKWWRNRYGKGGIGRRRGEKATLRQYAVNLEGFFETCIQNQANGNSNGRFQKTSTGTTSERSNGDARSGYSTEDLHALGIHPKRIIGA